MRIQNNPKKLTSHILSIAFCVAPSFCDVAQAEKSAIGANDVPIPEPVALPVELSWKPNQPGKLSYVPSQLFAPFPDRLRPTIAAQTTGIKKLASDRQIPLADGVRLLPDRNMAFELSYRRAGIKCQQLPMLLLRVERRYLTELRFGIREGDTFWPLDKSDEYTCSIRPGRVIYELKDDTAQLGVKMIVLMPLSPPAYGCLARVEVRNLAARDRQLDIVAIAKGGFTQSDWWKPKWSAPDAPLPQVQTKPGTLTLPAGHDKDFYHDTNYSVLIAFDGDSSAGYRADDKIGLCTTRLSLPAQATATTHLAAVADSPGWEEAAIREHVEGFFEKNQNLPKSLRQDMVDQALDTFVHLAVNGDAAFDTIRSDMASSFDKSLRQWDNGAYRDAPVRFEMTDKKLQALANLTANDLFPGLIQPPGLVHNAQHNDVWGFIFCYRHVHAASDIAFERQALGYMRLLSANQKGPICSTNPQFKHGHPTRFDASYIDSLWHYYKWTGDLEAVRQLWPTLERAVKYIDRSLDGDGDGLYKDTLHQWKSDFDNRGPSSSFQTAIVWRALTDMVEFAQLLGDEEAADMYRAKADKTHRAVQTQLWSDEFAMLGAKGPRSILRLHPQSLEIEMPIWTGLVDAYQAQALLDWSTANLEFGDEAGGRWMYHNDWWPAVWSQHCPAQGDAMMVGWAHLLGGRHDIGNNILRTIAAGSARSSSPGFTYLFSPSGTTGGSDPATAQGAFIRTLVEGTFGVRPAIDQKRIALRPHFPSDWDHARFNRPGLEFIWDRNTNEQIVQVKTDTDVRAVVELSVNAPVAKVTLDGQTVPIELEAAMYWGIVRVVTPPGGGNVSVRTTGQPAKFTVPERAQVGQPVQTKITGVEDVKINDRFGMVDVVSVSNSEATVRPRRQGTGRCLFFLECQRGNLQWTQPIALQIGPRRAIEAMKRTVDDPLPAGARYVPVDLSDGYAHDIQKGRMGYWTMLPWVLDRDFPTKVRVGEVPFLLGPMGPNETAMAANDLIMLANTIGPKWQWDHTDPKPAEGKREYATAATIRVNRKLHKFHLLSVNMNLPQKCYVPAVEVQVRYQNGTEQTSVLAPPANFDCYYQDFGINTKALPLPFTPKPREDTPGFFGYDMREFHLTMTDVICDPARTVESIELRAIATETYFGLAGLTLTEATNS